MVKRPKIQVVTPFYASNAPRFKNIEERFTESALTLNEHETTFNKFGKELIETGQCNSETFDTLFPLMKSAFDSRNFIKIHFSKFLTYQIENRLVRNIIKRIRDKDDFVSVEMYERIIQYQESQRLEPSFPEVIDSFGAYYDWEVITCSCRNLFFNEPDHVLIDFGPILHVKLIPDNVGVFYNEVLRLFGARNYIAVIALCRTLLELSVYYALFSIDRFIINRNRIFDIVTGEPASLAYAIKIAYKHGLLDEPCFDLCDKIRRYAISFIHPGLDHIEMPNTDKARDTIIATVRTIEHLYT